MKQKMESSPRVDWNGWCMLVLLIAILAIGGIPVKNSSAQGPAANRSRPAKRIQQAPTSQEQGKIFGSDPRDETAAVDRKPYFEIRLNKDNDFAILHVMPKLMDRNENVLTPPFNLKQNGFCVFRFADDQAEMYEVPWVSIEKISTFEELVLAEADKAMQQRDLATAFKSYLFLYDRNRLNLELRKQLEQYLYMDGKKLFDEGRYSEARTVLEELYDRKPGFVPPGQPGGLIGMIAKCYDKLIEQKADANDLPTIRTIVTNIEKKYGQRMENISQKWRREIEIIGNAVLEDARRALEGDDPYEAHRKVRVMMHAIPEVTESKQLFDQVVKKFPYVFVGVAQQPLTFDRSSIHHWGDRRIGQLTRRNLIEFLEPGDEGGKYVFPSGQFGADGETGMRFKFDINSLPGQTTRLGIPTVSAYHVSSRLLQLGDLESQQLHVPWARIVKSVEIKNENTVIVNLRFPHVRPECLLQVPYSFLANRVPLENGMYKTFENLPERTVYQLNPEFPPVQGRQHPKIIERKFKSRSAAVEALELGEVDAVDRVFPGDIRRLKRNPDIEVKAYSLPTVHMLVPNQRNDYMKSRDFRIGLLYGLNRELILSQMITGGQQLDGFEVVSGPLPLGSLDSDQTAYGYNNDVQPSIYNIYLGLAMVEFTHVQLINKMRKRAEKFFEPDFDLLTKEDPKQELLKKLEETVAAIGNNEDELLTSLFPEFSRLLPDSDPDALEIRLTEFLKDLPMVKKPTITIAYPSDDLIELCCETIQQSWAVLGVDVKLRRLPAGVTVPEDQDYDFLYAEITMNEPLLDIGNLIGERGLAPVVSASINQELQRLARADRWTTVFNSLKAIHRHCHSEMAVLPLWQVSEHYAFRKNLKNTGSRISSIYQNVDRWQLDPPGEQ